MKRLVDKKIDLASHDKPYVGVRALALYLDCDPRTVLRMIHVGTLIAVKVGREWRVPTVEARRAFHVQQHQQAS